MKMMYFFKGYDWYVIYVLKIIIILGIYFLGEFEVDFVMVVKFFFCLVLFFIYLGMD